MSVVNPAQIDHVIDRLMPKAFGVIMLRRHDYQLPIIIPHSVKHVTYDSRVYVWDGKEVNEDGRRVYR